MRMSFNALSFGQSARILLFFFFWESPKLLLCFIPHCFCSSLAQISCIPQLGLLGKCISDTSRLFCLSCLLLFISMSLPQAARRSTPSRPIWKPTSGLTRVRLSSNQCTFLPGALRFQYLRWYRVARQAMVFLSCVCKCIPIPHPQPQYTIPSKQVEVPHFCQGDDSHSMWSGLDMCCHLSQNHVCRSNYIVQLHFSDPIVLGVFLAKIKANF